MLDKQKFYRELRKGSSGLFGTSLSQKQVDGMENLLDVWSTYVGGPIDALSYNLATSYHETARTMQPIMERGKRAYFNKYEPGTRLGKVLGNTVPGDGYKFRGAGHVQNTGRRNAEYSSKQLQELFGLDVDFVENPDLRLDPVLSALSLFVGNQQGWWTGKGLSKYLDGVQESAEEDFREYENARAVVNGRDRAKLIAQYAVSFEKALRAAGYETVPPKSPEPETVPAHVPNKKPAAPVADEKPKGFFAVLLDLLLRIFSKKD